MVPFERGKMRNDHGELNGHAASCEEQARLAIQNADKALSEESRAEYLKLATECLRLAEEIRNLPVMFEDYRVETRA